MTAGHLNVCLGTQAQAVTAIDPQLHSSDKFNIHNMLATYTKEYLGKARFNFADSIVYEYLFGVPEYQRVVSATFEIHDVLQTNPVTLLSVAQQNAAAGFKWCCSDVVAIRPQRRDDSLKVSGIALD
jgi:hypothetical protein